nr:hypothetical protein [Tanacetum cinerariifolium]
MIGEITGSEFRIGDSVGTTEGWTFSVLPSLVGCTMSLVASVSRYTTGEEDVVGIVGPGYAVPLLVVIPFRSSIGLVIVLTEEFPNPMMKREFIGGDNLRLRNLGLMNRSLVNQSLISEYLISLRLVLTLVSSLEELVSSLVIPPRVMVSLIPVLVLKVMVLIVSVLILVETWWS